MKRGKSMKRIFNHIVWRTSILVMLFMLYGSLMTVTAQQRHKYNSDQPPIIQSYIS